VIGSDVYYAARTWFVTPRGYGSTRPNRHRFAHPADPRHRRDTVIVCTAGSTCTSLTRLTSAAFGTNGTTEARPRPHFPIRTNSIGVTVPLHRRGWLDHVFSVAAVAVNNPPVAADFAATVNQTPDLLTVSPTSETSNRRQGYLTAAVFSGPSHGTLTLNPTGRSPTTRSRVRRPGQLYYQATDGIDNSNSPRLAPVRNVPRRRASPAVGGSASELLSFAALHRPGPGHAQVTWHVTSTNGSRRGR